MSSQGAKEFREIIAELRYQGWNVNQTTQGHYKACPPDKTKEIIHFSLSTDTHAQLNTIRDLKKQGFQWPPPSKNEQAGTRRERPAPLTQKLDLSGVLASGDGAAAPPSAEQLVINDLPPIVETEEARMDRLFKELKDAKVYAVLTEDHVKECKRAVEEATRALAEAAREHDAAAEALVKKKFEFDTAFTAAA